MTLGQGEKVTFKCAGADATPIFISGNIPELGSWNANDALTMTPQHATQADRHEWTAQIILQHGETIEFKFVKKTANGVVWERGDNRRYTVIPGHHTLSDAFRE